MNTNIIVKFFDWIHDLFAPKRYCPKCGCIMKKTKLDGRTILQCENCKSFIL